MFTAFHIGYIESQIAASQAELRKVIDTIPTTSLGITQRQEVAKQLENDLFDMRKKLSQLKAKPPRSFSSKLLIWTCMYAVVAIAIAFLAGCKPVEAGDSVSIGNNIAFTRDYANGNICYARGNSGPISCVPMRE